jgi:hypothetical protein
MEATDKYGSVESGKLADLVLLDADPIKDIHNTTKISEVFLAGKEFDRPAIRLAPLSILVESRANGKLFQSRVLFEEGEPQGTQNLEPLSLCHGRVHTCAREKLEVGSRASTASRWVLTGCSGTSSPCESRWKPGRKVN